MREKAESLRQQQVRLPDLEVVCDRVLSSLKVGKQAPEYKRTKSVIDRLIFEMRVE